MSYKKPVSNEACVLLRFPNEKENGDDGNICIGYQQWLEIKDVKNIPKIINKKKLIKTMWPVNVALSEASKINKELKNAVWRSFAGYILDVGGKIFELMIISICTQGIGHIYLNNFEIC